jgi:subtilisin-like proprotein convertase family protein
MKILIAGALGLCLVSNAMAKSNGESVVPLRFEILPGEREKWVDTVLAEPVPVAILGSMEVDVRDIEPASLVLAGAAATKGEDGSLASYRDENGDGISDLLVRFPSRSMLLDQHGKRVWLSGETRDGRALLGSGSLAALRDERVEHTARAAQKLQTLPPIQARIDLLPGDPANVLELGNRGTVEVALLSASGFDATRIDPLLLRLEGAPVTRGREGRLASVRDVDGDGRDDLVVEVAKALLQVDAETREVVLTGMTPEGRLLTARDDVSLAPTATFAFDSDDPTLTPRAPSIEFSSAPGINILDAAAASPYPSQIQVSGLTGVISKVRVTLKKLSHPFPSDIDILLVGPTGQSLVLMSDVGSGAGAASVTLTFDDDAAHDLDPLTPMTSGTYRPINIGGSDVFPAPAPAPSGAVLLQAFAGTNPTGTWSLFVVDDRAGSAGVIAGGWSLDFVMATEFCSAGPLTINDQALATPYPLPIVVAGLTGAASKVTATLKGFSHTSPLDVQILLASPAGPSSLLMAETGGGTPGVSGVTLVLDDNAPLGLDPDANPASGTYRPAAFGVVPAFPAPAPPAPYPVNLGVFQGFNPNGTWNVLVRDVVPLDTGSIASVCLRITTLPPAAESNQAAIAIPAGAPGATAGPAGPYPSTIDISGVIGTLLKATVTLHGVTHTFPRDIDALLQSPSGRDVLLMSDVGGSGPGIAGVDYTFDDAAATSLPTLTNVGSGTFKPSNDNTEGLDIFPAPAPPAPYGAALVDLAGFSPNGTWRLYVFDDRAGDVGRISSGWSLTLSTWLPTFRLCSVAHTNIPAGAPGTTQGPSDFYGSGIVIPQIPVDMTQYKLRVDLVGLSHTFPRDLDILLVGPEGQSALLMSDAGGGLPGISNVSLSFDDDAASGLAEADNPASGTYLPTDFDSTDLLAPPAPGGPYGSSLSVFKGTYPSGLWALYVFDDSNADTGSFEQWCLNFIPSIDADEVQNLRFTNNTTVRWDAGPNATFYALYRGTPDQLANLDDDAADACLLINPLGQQFGGLTEVPPIGSFFWYLVRGNNAQGEGPAGFQNLNGQLRARVMSSSGACP